MCEEMRNTRPCSNYQCCHNLFWDGLGLNMDNIQITDKALRIKNCCRLICEPWACEEIATVWGLTKERVKRFEESARRKLQRRTYIQESRQAIWMTEQNTV